MKKKYIYIALILCFALVTGCGKIPKLQNGEELVASIDGKEISAEELFKELKKSQGTTSIVNMIDAFIANKEIENNDEAKKYADAQLEQLKFQYEYSGQDFALALLNAGYESEDAFKEVIIMDYKKQQVAKNFIKNKITDEEIKTYYDKNIFGKITVKHILIKPDTTTDTTEVAETKAKEKAQELINQLKNGADFEALAKEHSQDDGTKENGGLFVADKSTTDTDFWNASYALEDGKFTEEPVKSQFGYHIIIRTSAEERPTLESSKESILTSLATEKLESSEEESMRVWSEIRAKYNLNIIDSDIKKIYEKTIENLNAKK